MGLNLMRGHEVVL